MKPKRFAVSLLAGCVMACIPWMLGDSLGTAALILSMPGLVPALALAGLHASPAVVVSANLAYYSLLTYSILTIREAWRSET